MKFISFLYEKFRKMRRIGWKASVVITLIYFIKYPEYLSDIPGVGWVFETLHWLFDYLSEFNIVKSFENSSIGETMHLIMIVLTLVAAVIPFLWLISVVVTPITGAILKRFLKKNKDSEKYIFSNSGILTVGEKLKAAIRLKELHEATTPVFHNNKTYLRVQNLYEAGVGARRFNELREWDNNNCVILPYTFCNEDHVFKLVLKDDSVEVYSDKEDTGSLLELNNPVVLTNVSDSGKEVRLFAVTWIGDVYKC